MRNERMFHVEVIESGRMLSRNGAAFVSLLSLAGTWPRDKAAKLLKRHAFVMGNAALRLTEEES